MKPILLLIGACALNAWLAPHAFAVTATNLSSFEGIEEPETKYFVVSNRFESDTFTNITDVGDHTVRMFLRYHTNDWWDGDRNLKSRDRQRAEVKGVGPHQETGETFEYSTTWRTDPAFQGGNRFCHVFQLKATDGDKGAPLVVLSVLAGTNSAAVRYWPGNNRGFIIARRITWKPGVWQNIRIRIKTSPKADGEVLVSVDGDEFQGAKDVAVFRPSSTDYRPKWGLYRGVNKDMPFGDDYVEHKNATAQKL